MASFLSYPVRLQSVRHFLVLILNFFVLEFFLKIRLLSELI